tara:strand:- start:2103 stop:2252 length:150 start_codon:yes stop_codon:yes gene_type:complete
LGFVELFFLELIGGIFRYNPILKIFKKWQEMAKNDQKSAKNDRKWLKID